MKYLRTLERRTVGLRKNKGDHYAAVRIGVWGKDRTGSTHPKGGVDTVPATSFPHKKAVRSTALAERNGERENPQKSILSTIYHPNEERPGVVPGRICYWEDLS